jgi:hypothetical protein
MDNLQQVIHLAKTVLTEEDKRTFKVIASELLEICKTIDKLAETMVKLSDKELLKAFNANKYDLNESQVESYKERQEKQLDIAKREFQS